MLPHYHYHFFKGRVACTFANTVYGAFNLPGAANNPGNCVCSSQAEIVMAMDGDFYLIYAFHMFHQVPDLRAILIREAVTRSIGDIEDRCPGFYDGRADLCQKK